MFNERDERISVTQNKSMNRYIAHVELGDIQVCLVRENNELVVQVNPNIPHLGEGNCSVIGSSTINFSI